MALHSIDFNLYPTNWLNVKFSTEIYAYISFFHSSLLCFIFFFLLFLLILEAGCALLLTYSLYTTPKTSALVFNFLLFTSSGLVCDHVTQDHKLSHPNCLNVVKLSKAPKKNEMRKEIGRVMWKFISSILMYTLIRGNLWIVEHVLEEWRMDS